MCDYSLMHVRSRPASVSDKLTTRHFGSGTVGFAASEDCDVAVCVLPGTEIAFDAPITERALMSMFGPVPDPKTYEHTTARFRQINKNEEYRHHDALELPDGQIVMLTALAEGQTATVLQLPAAPKTEAEAQEQKRLEVVG